MLTVELTREPLTPVAPPADDTAKWAALKARDAQADGSFVYPRVPLARNGARNSLGSKAGSRRILVPLSAFRPTHDPRFPRNLVHRKDSGAQHKVDMESA